jgi:D-sedoheptulose 7-phosphate isomerase
MTDPVPATGAVLGAGVVEEAEGQEGVCVTCSDTAVPMTVLRLLGDDLALVDTGHGHEEVSVALVAAQVGDTIMVHAGEAIAARDDNPTERDPADIASLYPFLYSHGTNRGSNLDEVLHEVRGSIVAKAKEIIALRQVVLRRDQQRLLDCAQAMARRFAAGGRLLAFGNGGSATDAQDLASLFLSPAGDVRPLPAFGLTNDVAVITALTNDVGFDVVFSRQIAAVCQRNDIAIGLSTSGNSANLLRAFDEASRRGLLTIGIAGYDGGKMTELDGIDYLFVVPSASVHRIQEAQTTIYHALWELTITAMGAGAPRHGT